MWCHSLQYQIIDDIITFSVRGKDCHCLSWLDGVLVAKNWESNSYFVEIIYHILKVPCLWIELKSLSNPIYEASAFPLSQPAPAFVTNILIQKAPMLVIREKNVRILNETKRILNKSQIFYILPIKLYSGQINFDTATADTTETTATISKWTR